MGIGLDEFSGKLLSLIDTSDLFFNEIDIEEAQKFMAKISPLYEDEHTLDKLLTEKSWITLKNELRPHIASFENLKKLKPWAVYLFVVHPIVNSYLYHTEGMVGVTSFLDVELKDYAKSQGVPVKSLEKSIDQFQHIEEIYSIEKMEKTLTEEGSLVETEKNALRSLIGCYKKSDANCIKAIAFDEGLDDTMMALIERHTAWIPKIESALAREEINQIFVAVGNAHFIIGENNLLMLLQKRGFQVTPANL